MGRQLEEAYAGSGQIRFDYKGVAFLGPESFRAAEAAACANEQDSFWPYHDTLYANQRGENQGAFRDDALQAFAVALGLDEGAFNDCLDSGRYQDEVQAETIAAQERGVRVTPTLFFNGEQMEGIVPFEQLQSLIEAELAGASAGSE